MKLSALILALSVGLATWTATAQPSDDAPPPGQDGGGQDGSPGGGRHHRPPMPIVKALDANGDGVIDATEIANAPTVLKTLDKNGDGKLTFDEYMPHRPGGGQGPGGGEGPGGPPPDGAKASGKHRHPPIPIIDALDANHDGVIDASEMANASTALLKLDKNHDGKLTPDEYRPHRPQGGPPPDGDGGPGPDGDGPNGPPPGQ